jgi:hypothetical protein
MSRLVGEDVGVAVNLPSALRTVKLSFCKTLLRIQLEGARIAIAQRKGISL